MLPIAQIVVASLIGFCSGSYLVGTNRSPLSFCAGVGYITAAIYGLAVVALHFTL